jgi:hypothetical protein
VYRRNGISAGLWTIAVVGLAFSFGLNLARHALGGSGAFGFWLFGPSVSVITGSAGAVLVAWVASRFFVAGRQNGTLELLLTTPLGAESLVAEQVKVLRRVFALPILLMQAAVIPQLAQGLMGTNTGVGGQGYFAFSTLFNLANTFLGVETLCWLGLWFGVKARTQAGAIMWTVILGNGFPNLVNLVGSLLESVHAQSPALSPRFFPGLWFLKEIVNLLFYLFVIYLTRVSLPRELVGAAPKALGWQVMKTHFALKATSAGLGRR